MMNNVDGRRVARSKISLQRALMDLVAEMPFDKITVKDILDRANVGRTTFYAHFQSKEDLFLSTHEGIIEIVANAFFAEDGTLRDHPAPEIIRFLEMMMNEDRNTFFNLTWGSSTSEILRLLKERIAAQMVVRLHMMFREQESTVPFVILARHVADSVMGLSSWWVEKRMPYTPQEMALMLHQINYAALRDALGK